MKKSSGRLVYSTDMGRTCPDCHQAIDSCICDNESVPEGDGIVRLMLDRKGRKGKGMTLVTGLGLPEKELKALAKTLKQKCGVGGSTKNHVIEIQGDHRNLIKELLEQQGYTVKLAGG